MDLARRIRQLRQYGWTSKYTATIAGGRNSRLDEIQAAVLRAKLPYLDTWNERRRTVGARYSELLRSSAVKIPANIGSDYVAHLFVVRSPHRDLIREALAARGIASEVHYPIPDYRQDAINLSFHLPATERCCKEVLTLPCFPEITESEIEEVAAIVTETLESAPESN